MKIIQTILLVVALLANTAGFSQGDTGVPVFQQALSAIKSGDAKTLAMYFNKTISLNFDGEVNVYSKTQSEFVLKEFFKKYPVKGFEYVHMGKSPEGLRYGIGKYTYIGGSNGSFLVYIMIKEANGEEIIDSINFHEEDD